MMYYIGLVTNLIMMLCYVNHFLALLGVFENSSVSHYKINLIYIIDEFKIVKDPKDTYFTF